MRHVTHMNESCRTCECVMSHIWMSHVAHVNASWRRYECVMLHTWMSHVTHMNESRPTYGWVTPHICNTNKATVRPENEWVTSHIPKSHVRYMNESCHTYECIMSLESCHTHEWRIYPSSVLWGPRSFPPQIWRFAPMSHDWYTHMKSYEWRMYYITGVFGWGRALSRHKSDVFVVFVPPMSHNWHTHVIFSFIWMTNVLYSSSFPWESRPFPP